MVIFLYYNIRWHIFSVQFGYDISLRLIKFAVGGQDLLLLVTPWSTVLTLYKPWNDYSTRRTEINLFIPLLHLLLLSTLENYSPDNYPMQIINATSWWEKGRHFTARSQHFVPTVHSQEVNSNWEPTLFQFANCSRLSIRVWGLSFSYAVALLFFLITCSMAVDWTQTPWLSNT